MDRSYRILPTYTGDVSGVASALYELGGMVVIHDPSGCNSTYNTHDEIRWYDRESLIFISGLAARDAVLGNDNKFVKDVCDTADYYRPAFIALVSSPIPFMNGTDFPALARIIERRTGIRTFFVMTNGMHDYVRGAGNAFLKIAENFVAAPAQSRKMAGLQDEASGQAENSSIQSKVSVNILGLTPLDFAAEGAVDRLKNLLTAGGFDVLTCWAMGSTLDDLRKSAEADVNLVVSSTGLQTAHFMEEKFGIPFVAGLPVGAFTGPLMKALAEAAGTGKSALPCRDLREMQFLDAAKISEDIGAAFISPENAEGPGITVSKTDEGPSGAFSNKESSLIPGKPNKEPSLFTGKPNEEPSLFTVGEVVAAGSYAAAVEMQTGRAVRVVTPLEDSAELLGPGDLFVTGETEVEEALKDADLVIGDAFYEAVCPAGCEFISLPHLAFSGRNAVKDLRTMDPFDIDSLLAGRQRLP